tara:strand:+ start:1918 stop:2694 length:777 start_codon:yes stop_codon:yes gene_type:complete
MEHVPPILPSGTPAASGTEYTNGDRINGTQGSIPNADFFNVIQAEIINAITAAGLTPDSEDLTQLAQAIGKEIASQAEAEAGLENTKIMTALRVKQAIEAFAVPSGITIVDPVTLSGTNQPFNSIPAAAKRIDINFMGVSLSGDTNILVRMNNEASNYQGLSQGVGISSSVYSSGFKATAGATNPVVYHGHCTLIRASNTDPLWTFSTNIGADNTVTNASSYGGGSKLLAADLTSIQIVSEDGSSTFDAGKIGISYEV